MRGSIALVIAAAGCGFQGRPEPATADAPHVDGEAPSVDVTIPTGACNGKRWLADFSTNPTDEDLNGDGVKDWAMRDGSAFPISEMNNGTWTVAGSGSVLDTQPKQPFTTRTLVHARMRGTTPVASASAHGAVFWINVGYDDRDNTFAPLYVDVKLNDDTSGFETVSAFTKTTDGHEQLIGLPAQFGGDDFHDIELDIDPSRLAARISYDGGPDMMVALTRLAPGAPPNPGDRWATLTSFGTGAEFDEVSVEVCPP